MAKSLQEQLMGAGLVDNKKAKSIKQEQRKKKKQQPKGRLAVDETQERIEQARLEKAEKDRALNQQIKAQAEEKAILAQIKQLISSNTIAPESDEVGYQFADGTKIQKIYVSNLQQRQLASGVITIVKSDDRYLLVPKLVSEKIAQRDESFVIPLKLTEEVGEAEDDPYAAYQIPDDLMW